MKTKPRPRNDTSPAVPKPASRRKAAGVAEAPDTALAGDDLPKAERIEHQNDLA